MYLLILYSYALENINIVMNDENYLFKLHNVDHSNRFCYFLLDKNLGGGVDEDYLEFGLLFIFFILGNIAPDK